MHKGAEKKIVVANWKMNPRTIGEAKALFLEIKKGSTRRSVEVVVAPPFPYLAELRKLTTGTHTVLGAQNVFWEKDGPHTGEVSASMLESVGVTHAIVGHSERRVLGEDNKVVSKKVFTALKAGLTVILCIGESERTSEGQYLSFIEEELRSALKGVAGPALKRVIVAYEPIWAISKGDGKGKTATPDDVHEMGIFIRKVLTSMYTRKIADGMRIIYGGSVHDKNAAELLKQGMVDGFLVGGASLKPVVFSNIIAAAHATHKD